MSKIPLTASLEETLTLYNQKALQAIEDIEKRGVAKLLVQLPFAPFFGTTYIPSLADKLKHPYEDGQDDPRFWVAYDINADPREAWTYAQFDEEVTANWKEETMASRKLNKTIFRVTHNGVIIDAHWNCFRTKTEAKDELKGIVHQPGSSYGIVKVTTKALR